MDDVPAKLLQDVLSDGCQYLSLNCSTVEGNLVMNKSCQLRYLDMTTIEATNIKLILKEEAFTMILALTIGYLGVRIVPRIFKAVVKATALTTIL